MPSKPSVKVRIQRFKQTHISSDPLLALLLYQLFSPVQNHPQINSHHDRPTRENSGGATHDFLVTERLHEGSVGDGNQEGEGNAEEDVPDYFGRHIVSSVSKVALYEGIVVCEGGRRTQYQAGVSNMDDRFLGWIDELGREEFKFKFRVIADSGRHLVCCVCHGKMRSCR